MSEFDYQGQAERFVSWFSRLPRGASLKGAFKGWADSKDFHPEDQGVIWDLVQKELRR